MAQPPEPLNSIEKIRESFGERPFTPTPLSFPQNKKLILRFKKSRFGEKNN